MPRTRSPRHRPVAPSAQCVNSPQPDGEQYLRARIAEQELADGEVAEHASDKDADFEDDVSVLSQIVQTNSSESSICAQ